MLPLIGALLIGITLGLLGSGGSILTVPVLVYLLGHVDKVAIAESLAIVGTIALVGIVPYARSREVDWRSVLYFGGPGMLGTYGGAWLSHFVSGTGQLVLFALVMLTAAWRMFRNARRPVHKSIPTESTPAAPGSRGAETVRGDADLAPVTAEHIRHPLWQIALEGSAVGVMAGLVGVGGGFLIVPALVLLGGLSMRRAVGTSLAIIALTSVTGFYKYLGVLSSLNLGVDWTTVGLFIAIGIVGSLLGRSLSSRIDQMTLRRAFAVFLVVMGLGVLGKEAPRLFAKAVPQPSVAAANVKHNVTFQSGATDVPRQFPGPSRSR